MSNEFITRSSEFWIYTRISVLGPIDHTGIMFDSHAHREFFRNHLESFCMNHLVGITSRVSNRENQSICLYRLISIDHNSLEYTVFYDHISHTSTKANIRTKRNNLFSKTSHHQFELISTNMSLRHIEDFFWSTRLNKLLKYILTSWIVDQGIEFSIGECPCSSLSELDI